MDRLKGKIALVTGATMGQGEEIARLFVKKGAIVILADINEEGKQTANNIAKETSGTTDFIQLDVSSSKEWEKAVIYIEKKYKKLDILVNNAGILNRQLVSDLKEEEWDKNMNVNAKSVFLGMQSTLSLLKKSKEGAIVNNASIWSLVGNGTSASYHASKGAVRSLTKTAAIEFAEHSIRVNCIHPGLVRSSMTKTLLTDPEKTKDRVGPIGRAAEPIEIAYAALFLASNESSFITGIDLPVDGGYTAR